MRLVAMLVVAAAAPAAAAPCEVEVVRAPEGVREVVERSLALEPPCATSFAVRIVESTDGLYVVAQDRDGRVRDRVVPDAQAAGVLVASWASDGSVPSAAPIIATARVEAEPVRRDEHLWIRFGMIRGLAGAMLAPGDDSGERSLSNGARGSVGVWTRGAWTIDASFDFVDDLPLAIGYGGGVMAVREYNALANLGYVLRSGRWSLTPSVGLGLRRSTLDFVPDINDLMTMYPYGVHRQGFFGVAQASALAAVDVADRFQLVVQLNSMLHTDPWQMHENLELVWIAGIGVVL